MLYQHSVFEINTVWLREFLIQIHPCLFKTEETPKSKKGAKQTNQDLHHFTFIQALKAKVSAHPTLISRRGRKTRTSKLPWLLNTIFFTPRNVCRFTGHSRLSQLTLPCLVHSLRPLTHRKKERIATTKVNACIPCQRSEHLKKLRIRFQGPNVYEKRGIIRSRRCWQKRMN